jgi:hypothetical protein
VTTVVDVLSVQLLVTRAVRRIASRIAITRRTWRRYGVRGAGGGGVSP